MQATAHASFHAVVRARAPAFSSLTGRPSCPACAARAAQVETPPCLSRVLSARVQQAFLPKFENEGQDAEVG